VRPSVAVVALVLLAVVATAAAQQPSAAAGVSVTLGGEVVKPSIDKPGTFHATVKNTGTPSNSPLDAQNQANVDVKVTGTPPGWTAVASPASFKLSPGQQQDVTVTVSVSGNAEAKSADIVVTADLTTSLESLDPILGGNSGQSQRATGQATQHIVRDDSVTRTVLETLGPWIYAVLLLLVAAVFVAVAISLAARRSLVRLSTDTRELGLPPGGRAVFPFKVEGLAKQEDSVLLQVSAVQEGWAAFLPVPELVLDPGQVQELTLVVIAPKNVTDGARQAVLVSATSAKAPKGAANLEFVATVHSGSPVRAAKRVKEA
jgi:uncharacterized membrane protein